MLQHAGGGGQHPAPPRRGVTCAACARSKVKCERVAPCARCTRLGYDCVPRTKARKAAARPALDEAAAAAAAGKAAGEATGEATAAGEAAGEPRASETPPTVWHAQPPAGDLGLDAAPPAMPSSAPGAPAASDAACRGALSSGPAAAAERQGNTIPAELLGALVANGPVGAGSSWDSGVRTTFMEESGLHSATTSEENLSDTDPSPSGPIATVGAAVAAAAAAAASLADTSATL